MISEVNHFLYVNDTADVDYSNTSGLKAQNAAFLFDFLFLHYDCLSSTCDLKKRS